MENDKELDTSSKIMEVLKERLEVVTKCEAAFADSAHNEYLALYYRGHKHALRMAIDTLEKHMVNVTV